MANFGRSVRDRCVQECPGQFGKNGPGSTPSGQLAEWGGSVPWLNRLVGERPSGGQFGYICLIAPPGGQFKQIGPEVPPVSYF